MKPIDNKYIVVLPLTVIITGLLIGCSSNRFVVPGPLPDDRLPITRPKTIELVPYAEYFNRQFTQQVEQSLDFSRQIRNISGRRKEAINVDAFGEVVNSSWFTNRNGQKRMTLEEIALGPNTVEGPDNTSTWTITRAKTAGVTPGFTIKDSCGDNYLIKFDPPDFAELASGAEVVSTKLFHAAGYFTPENYIVYFRPEILRLADNVRFTDLKGRKRRMTYDDLEELLLKVNHLPDGRIRALASKYLPGIPIGPFSYRGARKDDPNDIIPHQHRRELRGLRVLVAWLNHFDTKDSNTLDTFIADGDSGYVRHNLIDFGGNLGSASHGPNPNWRGHQNETDPHVILGNLLTLGLNVKPWEELETFRYPSIGVYESELFKPHKYKPQVPNPAFENMTDLDGYWGTKLVMSFTDEQITAAVKEGQYSDPDAEAYLIKTIIERRNIIGRHWFNKVTPLDNFNIQTDNSGTQLLSFDDLAVETGLESAKNSKYRFEIIYNGETIAGPVILENQTAIPLSGNSARFKNPISDFSQKSQKDFIEIRIQTSRDNGDRWSKQISVYIASDDSITGGLSLAGVQH